MEHSIRNWRLATVADDDDIVSMCLALNAEDPGPHAVAADQIRRTLATLRDQPWRGRALVCALRNGVAGYALLISLWSNELGGEICIIDELFVVPEHRSRGLATSLIERLAEGDTALWPDAVPALALEVSAQNARARALYERLGFEAANVSMRRRLTGRG